MSYCGTDSTWASIEDLYERYGEEFINKRAVRRNFDSEINEYVADESPESIERVLNLAICDAKTLLLQKLSCLYSGLSILDESTFSGLKQWHIKIIIGTLEAGGNCMACSTDLDLNAYIGCGAICNDDGVCLSKRSTFVSVSPAVFSCECSCYGSCCCD